MPLSVLLMSFDGKLADGKYADLIDVKFAYGMGIEVRIYIWFAVTHLCG